MKVAIYPGSFDPVTNGHLDIIQRASSLFDHVVVAVSINSKKHPLFSLEERKEMLTKVTSHHKNVSIDSFEGLTVEYTVQKGAQVIIRGLRAVSDFENEFQMSLTNKKLQPTIETVFLMARTTWLYLSSSTVKEVSQYGANISDFVPKFVEERLREKSKSFKKEVINPVGT